jgi:hypothetical protein
MIGTRHGTSHKKLPEPPTTIMNIVPRIAIERYCIDGYMPVITVHHIYMFQNDSPGGYESSFYIPSILIEPGTRIPSESPRGMNTTRGIDEGEEWMALSYVDDGIVLTLCWTVLHAVLRALVGPTRFQKRILDKFTVNAVLMSTERTHLVDAAVCIAVHAYQRMTAYAAVRAVHGCVVLVLVCARLNTDVGQDQDPGGALDTGDFRICLVLISFWISDVFLLCANLSMVAESFVDDTISAFKFSSLTRLCIVATMIGLLRMVMTADRGRAVILVITMPCILEPLTQMRRWWYLSGQNTGWSWLLALADMSILVTSTYYVTTLLLQEPSLTSKDWRLPVIGMVVLSSMDSVERFTRKYTRRMQHVCVDALRRLQTSPSIPRHLLTTPRSPVESSGLLLDDTQPYVAALADTGDVNTEDDDDASGVDLEMVLKVLK